MRKSIHLFGVVTLLATGLPSCKTAYLLKEDFSADATGYSPKKDIAGEPTGDFLAYKEALTPRLTVEASAVKAGTKALAFSEAAIKSSSVLDGYFSFNGLPADYSKTTRFEWTAKHRNSVGTVMIDVMGPQNLWITRLYLRPDGQLLRVTDVTKQDGDVIGTLDLTQPHTIFITLKAEDAKKSKPQLHTFNLLVLSTKEGKDSNRLNLPVLFEADPKISTTVANTMLLSFSYQHEGADAKSAYVFESVNIVQQ